jgi:hypothetical protein
MATMVVLFIRHSQLITAGFPLRQASAGKGLNSLSIKNKHRNAKWGDGELE